MKVAFFSIQSFEATAFKDLNKDVSDHEFTFFTQNLNEETVSLAKGYPAISCFANDSLDAQIIETLAQNGTKLITLRCAGYDKVDVKAIKTHDITLMRVPAYSPYAIAEYTVGLLIALDRKITVAWDRVRDGNFDLSGLVGHGINGKTVGIIGTGKIGGVVARILKLGFGCEVLAYDIKTDSDLVNIGVRYVSDEKDLLRQSDIISLHCPLIAATRHLINAETLALIKPDALIVNTGRGGLVDTGALIYALMSGKLRGCALDVYEGEENFFFKPATVKSAADTEFQRLVAQPNVIVSGHQAFLTTGAVNAIVTTTLKNINNFARGEVTENLVPQKYLN
ncbi:hypothetical protein FQN57_005800 [Myotisia sp. PD_48]|nr:hypothetical protein FQN57_005800 [Myotisia sp. PD_48]